MLFVLKLVILLLLLLLDVDEDPDGDVKLPHINGVEFERPLDVKLFKVASVAFNDKKFTVSVRESSLSKGKRPSDTASKMHGSSPLSNAFESVFSGF
jgi:hypothetical protein